jgi:hypothetical protein
MGLVDSIRNFDYKEETRKLKELIESFLANYKEANSEKIRLIDVFIVFNFIILVLQLGYMLTNGLDPMNSFLSGIVCCLGSITLLVCLRLHVNPKSKLTGNSNEKVFAEFFITSLILYFVCVNFMG